MCSLSATSWLLVVGEPPWAACQRLPALPVPPAACSPRGRRAASEQSPEDAGLGCTHVVGGRGRAALLRGKNLGLALAPGNAKRCLHRAALCPRNQPVCRGDRIRVRLAPRARVECTGWALKRVRASPSRRSAPCCHCCKEALSSPLPSFAGVWPFLPKWRA